MHVNSHRNFGTDQKAGYRNSGDKYEDFKRSILDDFVHEKHGLSPYKKSNNKGSGLKAT